MEILLLIIIWGLFAWWAYNIAEKKGRNSVMWAVLVFVISPLLIIILGLLGKTEEKLAEERELLAKEIAKQQNA